MIALDSVFPMLKPASWMLQSGRSALVIESIPGHDENRAVGAPVLTFCSDKGETVSIIQAEDLTPDISAYRVEQAALQNLEYALSDIGWEEVDMAEHVPGMRVLVLSGNFYASEAILLPNRMMQAHRWLGARRILACVPSRGRLLITAAQEEGSDHVGVFIAGCLSEFYSLDEDALISPVIWVIEEGEIVGHLDVPSDVEDKIADQSRASGKLPMSDEVEVAQYEVEDPDGIRLRLVFEGVDPNVIIEAFDSVMRETVDQVTTQSCFNGKIQASVVMGHGHSIDRANLQGHIENKVIDLKNFIDGQQLISASGNAIDLAAHVVDTTADLQHFPKVEEIPEPPDEIAKKTIGNRLVFKPNQVAVSSLFGTPVAGLVMLALNYKNCGNDKFSKLFGVGALLALPTFALLLALLQGSTWLLFLLLSAATGMWYLCRSFPAVDYKRIPAHSIKHPTTPTVVKFAGGSLLAVLLTYILIQSLLSFS